MYIERIRVHNFRLLQDFSIDLRQVLSLVVGKNNSGKTSLLKVMDKFINGGDSKFLFEDFSLSFHHELEQLFAADVIEENDYKELGIYMQLLVKYSDGDDLEYISPLVSLDNDNNYVLLQFSYALSYTSYGAMRTAFVEFQAKENAKKVQKADYTVKTWHDFLKSNIGRYFRVYKRSLPVDKDGNYCEGAGDVIDLQTIRDVFHLEDLISFRYIDARRSVDNKDLDKTLSGQTSKLYQQLEDSEANVEAMEELRDKLRDMDTGLSKNYSDVFKEVIGKVQKFGGVQPNDTIIKIISNLREEILLKDHTTVVYEDGGKQLPENHNGLGFMNLISIIFDIESIRHQFARVRDRKPADINLLFIEEPEAHTHPQMQYIFIKNIKDLLNQDVEGKDRVKRKIQTVITTHSSHIVAECEFEDLKYLKREPDKGVIAKNMTDLEKEYGSHTEWFKFLKQYITLDRSELFFADKAIFIEGDTERILMPAMMKMVDEDNALAERESRLTSQNISIVAVGNYTHIFTKFFNFIGFQKICVVTDLDICDKTVNDNGKTVYLSAQYDSSKEHYTTNASLKEYFNKKLVGDYTAMTVDNKRVKWDATEGKWKQDTAGNVMVCFQSVIDGYQPRSFEDAFFATNKDFMSKEDKVFNGLVEKYLKTFINDKNPFSLAEKGIKSKATFAIDLLIDRGNSHKNGYVGWKIPQYIVDGLLWLRKD